MNGIRKTGIAVLSSIAIGAAGLVAAPTAQALPGATELTCTYQLKKAANKVSGGCSGSSPWGSASGTFDGKLRPNGSGKGSFTMVTELGTLDGSFNGNYFNGGRATGSFTVSLGGLHAFGSFVAWLG